MKVKQLLGKLIKEDLNSEVIYLGWWQGEPVFFILDTVDSGDSWTTDSEGLVPPKKMVALYNSEHYEELQGSEDD